MKTENASQMIREKLEVEIMRRPEWEKLKTKDFAKYVRYLEAVAFDELTAYFRDDKGRKVRRPLNIYMIGKMFASLETVRTLIPWPAIADFIDTASLPKFDEMLFVRDILKREIEAKLK